LCTASWNGRDTPPTAGADYVRQLQQKKMRELGIGENRDAGGAVLRDGTRDNRWKRVELALSCTGYTAKRRDKTNDPVAALQKSYEQESRTSFVKPIVVPEELGLSAAPARIDSRPGCGDFL